MLITCFQVNIAHEIELMPLPNWVKLFSESKKAALKPSEKF